MKDGFDLLRESNVGCHFAYGAFQIKLVVALLIVNDKNPLLVDDILLFAFKPRNL